MFTQEELENLADEELLEATFDHRGEDPLVVELAHRFEALLRVVEATDG